MTVGWHWWDQFVEPLLTVLGWLPVAAVLVWIAAKILSRR